MVKGKTAPKKALLDSHDCLVGCDESAVSIFHLLSVNLLSDLLVFVSQAFAFISMPVHREHREHQTPGGDPLLLCVSSAEFTFRSLADIPESCSLVDTSPIFLHFFTP